MTMSLRDGAYLIAFLALYVRLTGSHLWSIFCHFAFRVHSTSSPQSGLYHQQQAILRNSASVGRTLWDLVTVSYSWRGRVSRPFGRTIWLFMYASLHIVAFVAAGIFSSRVTTARAEVLVRGNLCGIWPNPGLHQTGTQPHNQSDLFERFGYKANYKNSLVKANAYASTCYNASSKLDSCLPYGREQISWSTSVSNGCPFPDASICRGNITVNFDSGLLNSHTHFGINSQERDRVEYRRTMSCSLISTDKYMVGPKNSTDDSVLTNYQPWHSNVNRTYWEYWYGADKVAGIPMTAVVTDYLDFNLYNSQAEWQNYLLA